VMRARHPWHRGAAARIPACARRSCCGRGALPTSGIADEVPRLPYTALSDEDLA
jgi:hypothetical protein